MNIFKRKDIGRLLNYIGSCEDFFSQYEIVNETKVYYLERMDLSYRYGILLKTSGNDGIAIPLSLRSYLNAKFKLNHHSRWVSDIPSMMNVFTNRYGVNFIVGFIKDLKEEYFESYLLIGNEENKFSCICCQVSDIICIRNTIQIPIFINKQIIDKRKINYNNTEERIILRDSV